MDDPFDVLEIDPGADEEAVERAYRRRAKETHPDSGGSREAFMRVRRAYEAIRDGSAGEQGSEADAPGERRGPRRRSTPEAEPTDSTDRPDGQSRVEYLNFAVLDDHGWELTDDDLFEKAARADLPSDDHGRLVVEQGETLLEAAENRGFAWPYACRGGACSNCAVALVEGEMPTPAGHILTEEWRDRGIRLSCLSSPVSGDAKVVYNVKHLPGLEELRLRPSRFGSATQD